MKKYNNLFTKIIDKSNLKQALVNAMRGKSHYSEVKKIKLNQQRYIDELHELVSKQEFKNSEYIIFEKNTGSKVRKIYKLPLFPDRILHHAIVQVMMPIWLKLLIRDTFSTIPNRGIHDGVNRIKTALKDRFNTTYTLKFDIRKYYQSIDHDILLNILSRKVKDEKLMCLFSEIIRSAPGVPIGNYISQWFGNLYLAYFDHYCKEELKAKYYFRYCDDVVILSSSKQYLHDIFNKITEYLDKELNLTIKGNYQIFPTSVRGIDFLGYRFFHDYTLVRKSIVKNFKHKLKHSQLKGDQLHSQLASYYGWFKHANAYNLLNKYLIDIMNKFSDFADEKQAFEGDKIRIDDVLNTELVVKAFRILNGKFESEKCLQLQINTNDKLHVIFTGSKVLTEQVTKYKDKLPFHTVIRKVRKYYTFS